MNYKDLKEFLDEKSYYYQNSDFIKSDPIQVPHQYTKKEDVEISAFLTATISWGRRESIIKNAFLMMSALSNEPYNFIMNHSKKDLKDLDFYYYRTFNSLDFKFFVKSLKNIYKNYGGLETIFSKGNECKNLQKRIHKLKSIFFSIQHEERTQKHISDPTRGSAAKRINMFLRWMVRSKSHGVDFGIWQNLKPSQLSIPLDIHSGNIARKLGLLKRNQNDNKAVVELDRKLRSFDPNDPVRYDFALFGLGIFEKF
ncbi:MAG: TIGR02757 family protein [Bacteroidota bacterium]|nr:TIGR02757 family protein [Bacteroidota bacterium]